MKKIFKATSLVLALCLLVSTFLVFSATGANENISFVYENLPPDELYAPYGAEENGGSPPTVTFEDGKFKVQFAHYEGWPPDIPANDVIYFQINQGDFKPGVGYDHFAFWIDTTPFEYALPLGTVFVQNPDPEDPLTDGAVNFLTHDEENIINLIWDDGFEEPAITWDSVNPWAKLSLPEGFKGFVLIPMAAYKTTTWPEVNPATVDLEADVLLLKFGCNSMARSDKYFYVSDFQFLRNGERPVHQDGSPVPSQDPSEPVDSEPVDSEPVDSEPIDSEPVDSEPIDSEPVDSEPVDTEPVDESEPADESEPVDESEDVSSTAEPPKSGASNNIMFIALFVMFTAAATIFVLIPKKSNN